MTVTIASSAQIAPVLAINTNIRFYPAVPYASKHLSTMVYKHIWNITYHANARNGCPCNIMLAKYGAISVYGQDISNSVISIETEVFAIVINVVVGIVLGGQPIFGYNFGAKNLTA